MRVSFFDSVRDREPFAYSRERLAGLSNAMQ